MYRLVEALDPASMYAIARFAFAELAEAGVTAVGEFHYVHHQPGGTPYDDRTILAQVVIQAARDVGLRITLLRVLYERGGAGQEPSPAQRRFCDADVDQGLADVEALVDCFRDDASVRVGIAPHSVRAVSEGWLREAAQYASARELPLHMHVAEQPREIEECLAEHGATPVAWLDRIGALSPRFCAVHATHLAEGEAELLGRHQASVCVCRTTERDLGDGLPNVSALAAAEVRLCTGVDSHAISDPFEEARAIELDERTRTERRQVALDGTALLRIASSNGYEAIGAKGLDEDRVKLDTSDLALTGCSENDAALFFAATPRAVRQVIVAGRTIVDGGHVPNEEEIRRDYLRVLAAIS